MRDCNQSFTVLEPERWVKPGKLQLDITEAWIAAEGHTNRNQLVYYVNGTL